MNDTVVTPLEEVKLALVTPVYQRHELTALCLAQRADQIGDFPVETVQIVIGDDPEHRAVARRLGLEWVECENDRGLGRKFNAGYARAAELGCTHAMGVGSDSFLHPDALADAAFGPGFATTITGLSCFREDGLERVDVHVRYPAGYGVGMVYPVPALMAADGGPVNPEINKGCDGSTWRRAGSGVLGVRYKERCNPLHYINFCSPDVQVTGYTAVKNVHASPRRAGVTITGPRVFDDLADLYGEHGAIMQVFYAARAVGALLTGKNKQELARERMELVKVKRSEAQERRAARRVARQRPSREGPFIGVRR